MKINDTQGMILGLLIKCGPMCGGEIVKEAEQRFRGFFNVTRSQIYRELPVLEELGAVKSLQQGPRHSQPYKHTAIGRRAFTTWQKSPGRALIRDGTVLRAHFAEM